LLSEERKEREGKQKSPQGGNPLWANSSYLFDGQKTTGLIAGIAVDT
jgi:hypothetical protein